MTWPSGSSWEDGEHWFWEPTCSSGAPETLPQGHWEACGKASQIAKKAETTSVSINSTNK